jgi:hypothetical protein
MQLKNCQELQVCLAFECPGWLGHVLLIFDGGGGGGGGGGAALAKRDILLAERSGIADRGCNASHA